jgi:hypothetical protein
MATVPTVPLIVVRPKCTSQTLEFYWRPPASDGGSPITDFILTDGTLIYNITGNPGYYKATGLTNGQTYSFTLAAINGIGTGPAAPFRSVEPGNKPQPPASITYTDQGSGNVLVNWTNPADIGGTSRLLGMLVRSFQFDSNNNVNLSSFSTVNTLWGGNAGSSYSYPFYSLSLGNPWQFQVQLQNDPGRTLRTMGFTSTFVGVFSFSPSSIGSMQLWLDANEVNGSGVVNPTQGTSISTWYDKSGRGNNAIGQSNPTMSTLSSLNIVYFNSKSMNTPMPSGGSNYSVFIIVNHSPAASYQRILNGGGSTSNSFLFIGSCNAGQYASFVGNGTSFNDLTVNSPATTVSNKMSLLEMIINTGSNYPFVDGSNQTAKSGITTQFSTLNIGGVSGGDFGQAFTGYTGEILFYSTVISPGNRVLNEGYLAWKWGISTSLQSWHPFYYRKPIGTDSNLDFSPSSLGGTQVWLDAADTTTIQRSGSTSTITSWTDKSGLGNNATAVNNPQYVPVDSSVYFNSASSQYFTFADGVFPFSNSSYSYYMAVQFSTFTDRFNVGLLGGGVANINNNSFNLRGSGSDGGITTFWWNNDMTTTNRFSLNQKTTVATYYSTNSTRNVRLNYQSTATDTPGIRTQPNTNNTLGRTVAAEHLFGRVHEVLVFSTMHSEFDRQRIEGYLAWKWGNQSFLPPTHLYYYRPPTRLDTFTAFSPSTITGLQLWTDASLFSVADNTSITMFSTLGTSYRGFQGAATVRSNALAGKSVVQILATQAMSTTGVSAISASNFAIFYVGRQFGGSSNNARVLQGDGNELYGYQAGGKPRWYSSEPGWIVQGNSLSDSNWDLWTFGRTTANLTTFNWNGSNQYNATNTPSINGLGFNKGAYVNESSDSQIAEIMVFSTSLTPTDYARVEGYLAWKWGLQANLPTSHPYYQSSTINLGPITSSIS